MRFSSHFLNDAFLFLLLCSTQCALILGNIVRRNISLTPAGRLACTLDDGCVLSNTPSLNFFVVGDIGGLPIYPYYSYAQNQVGKAMAKTAEKQMASSSSPLNFVVNLGDNFYFNGVDNVFDSRFEDSFEEVYDHPQLSVPWFTIGGNHDHLGNITAQLLHTNFSSKWTFPDLFYKISYSFGGPDNNNPTTVEMLMLDTIVLCGNTVDVQGESLFSWIFSKKKDPTGPPPEYVELAAKQWQWIEENLQSSKADYLFVSGHYPIYSTCEHGPFKCLIDKLDPLLRRYNVNAYFSGHDHNLQHIHLEKDNGRGDGSNSVMDYIVCGAASRSDRSSKHIDDVPEESLLFRYPTGWNPFSQIGFSNGAFIHAQVRPESALLKFYTGKQELKYETTFYPRNVVQ